MPLRLVTDIEDAPRPEAAPALVLEMSCDGLEQNDLPLLGVLQLILYAGETVLLCGANAGVRNAVMRCAAGLEPDMRGRLRLPRGVGAVLPDPALPRGRTALETVMMCAPVDPVAAFAVLSDAGLADRAEAPLRRLSKPLRRRLWLACACAGGPGLLVLNGLFDGLEAPERDALLATFAAMRAARGLGVLLSGQQGAALLDVSNRVVELSAPPGGIVTQSLHRPSPMEVPRRGT